ncbi:hypothetical protein FBD77_11725 [Clostridium butyricum]|nr:hypothetical protein [Clostridium butyricum]
MSKIEYMLYFLYICIAIVLGVTGAYYVVTMEEINIASSKNKIEENQPKMNLRNMDKL